MNKDIEKRLEQALISIRDMEQNEEININRVLMEHFRMIYVTAVEDVIRYADSGLQRFVFSRHHEKQHNQLFIKTMEVLKSYNPLDPDPED